MNHAGELAQLTALVRPHVAIVTTIAPAQPSILPDESAIADAKGEIFQGLEPGGVAIVPVRQPAPRPADRAAAARGADRVISFGLEQGADVARARSDAPQARAARSSPRRSAGRELSYAVAQPGRHWVQNALAVLAAVDAVGGDLALAGLALAELGGAGGARRSGFTIRVGGGEALLHRRELQRQSGLDGAALAVLGGARGGAQDRGARRDARTGRAHGRLSCRAGARAGRRPGVAAAILVGEATRPLAEALEGRANRACADCAAALRPPRAKRCVRAMRCWLRDRTASA